MILDETSSPSTGTAAQNKPTTNCEASAASVVITTNSDAKKTESKTAVTKSSGVQTLNAMNSNTFVVKLEPSPQNGAINRPPKTNLLQLFSENGKSKNLSFVKALGIGRIVVNRALLKNAKNKQTTTFSRQPWVSPQAYKTIELSRTSSFIRTAQQTSHLNEKENKMLVNNKKDDDISGNLANFMNFKLTGLVPTSMKTDLETNTFQINMKPPELRLPPSKQSTVSLSSSKSTSEEVKSKSSEPIDDDLTSLSWLTSSDKGLLETIRSCNPDDAGISLSGDDTDEEHDYNVVSDKTNAVFTAKSKVECGSQGGFASRQYGQPYSHNGKPPYSFSCLIFMAVEDSQDKMLPVKEIYSWVCKHFPYFLTAPSGWKNSIRHNLSLNKCFKKVDEGRHSHDLGKGSLWCIDPAYRPNLIQALKRTPFYPYLYPSGISQPLSLNNLASLLPGVISGRIPLWSPSMTQPNSSWADPDVASAALNLMELRGNDAIDRHPPKVRSTLEELAAEIFKQNDDVAGTIPLVISDPADDHTYSTMSFGKSKNEITSDRCLSPDSDKSAPDAAYEFETPGTDLESDVEIDERYSDDDCTDSDGDLADSGFARLRTKKESGKNKGNKTTKLPDLASKSKRSKSSTRNSSKSTHTRSKKSLKVRFQQTKKSKMASPAMRKLKRKICPKEADDVLTSDADSGKDSPKVQNKSRRRTSPKIAPPPAKKVKKTTFFKPKMHTSPYGTRSSKQTRCSRRIGALEHGNILERASARKRRQDSVTADTDDEEIKLAAGSLLHLAGFRSPP